MPAEGAKREGFASTCHELRIHTFCLFARNIKAWSTVDIFAVWYGAYSARLEPVMDRQAVILVTKVFPTKDMADAERDRTCSIAARHDQ